MNIIRGKTKGAFVVTFLLRMELALPLIFIRKREEARDNDGIIEFQNRSERVWGDQFDWKSSLLICLCVWNMLVEVRGWPILPPFGVYFSSFLFLAYIIYAPE